MSPSLSGHIRLKNLYVFWLLRGENVPFLGSTVCSVSFSLRVARDDVSFV